MVKGIFKGAIQFFLVFLICNSTDAQIFINEGSNRNYNTIADENGEYPDWIELYNSSADTISLADYSLTDDNEEPTKWTFPNISLSPEEFKIVYCSGKDRKPISGFSSVINTGTYNPTIGWNTHLFSTPFYWDGISNVLINVCSYSSFGYTSNSVFNQTITPFLSTVFSFQDGGDGACGSEYGEPPVYQRPTLQFNGYTVGENDVQNGNQDYPAPYGNWYWCAKNQMLVLASELIAAGLSEGDITSLAFDVVETDESTFYDYIDISMKMVVQEEVSSLFEILDTNYNLHTNFKIDSDGEQIYLYSPALEVVDSLFVNCSGLDNSTGASPDAGNDLFLFETATPKETNNFSTTFSTYNQAPTFSVVSGFYDEPFVVTINNPNGFFSTVFYTIDGSDPTINSIEYEGEPINIFYTSILRARVFSNNNIASPTTVSSYLLGINHNTPILSVVTDISNLYGETGIFTNYANDWEKAAYVEYFDTDQSLVFSQNAGMQVDGGYGGSRYHAQTSFRVELADPVLGDGSINYPIIPNRPERTKYSKFYLRNGSNQWLIYPYKDACQVECMAGETNIYYSAYRPITVYINGSYFGLYELREKFDNEYFEELEGANPDSIDILSLSAWNNYVLRAVEGSTDSFFDSYELFNDLNAADDNYWNLADEHFDLEYYTDYIIGESWMGNVDWPQNNIKIYRSNATNYRWRFCLIDLELALAPNEWTDCYFDHIEYMLEQSTDNPYINIWLKSLGNQRFKNYFINRFADVMNTAYKFERLSAIDNNFFDESVLEMVNEYERWGDPFNIPDQMNDFYENHLEFQFQISERTEQVRNQIEDNFSLNNQVDVTLDVHPVGAGKIHISTITPNTYPWEGVYFNGIPVKIEAIAENGYTFLNWGNNSLIQDTLNSVFNNILNVNNIVFDAYFQGNPDGLSDIIGNKEFILFPNPVKDKLSLLNKSTTNYNQLNYEITDLSGRIVLTNNIIMQSQIITLDVSALKSSAYFIKINNGKEIIAYKKFVK
jgi:CotH kinase protein/Secretion system C-terminal sorting domain/Fn3 associated